MGLVFLGIYIPLQIFEVYFVAPYIFDIASWVFFWEAVDQWFIHRREIKFEILKRYRFVRASIRVMEYKRNKIKKNKYGKNAKSLNNMLNRFDAKQSKIKKDKNI